MEKVLITGVAGFIGSNLAEYLLNHEYEIIGVDNLSNGNLQNLKAIKNHPNFKFYNEDILNNDFINNITIGIDYVLHQAAIGSVPKSLKNPILYNKVNIEGFLNVLNSSVKNKVKRFIYASSSSVYGDERSKIKNENIIGLPLSPYAFTKSVNEQYASLYSRIYNIETIGLRYFNVFGKNQNPQGEYSAVIPKFLNNLINNIPLQINGDGEFTRDFTYIENIVRANHLALKTKKEESLNTFYNISTGNSISINFLTSELVRISKKYFGDDFKYSITNGPKREGDVPHSSGNTLKAQKFLGYDNLISFNEGIEKYFNWFIKNERR
jgi:UDP-N-acetylglucosamine 4-epimerase